MAYVIILIIFGIFWIIGSIIEAFQEGAEKINKANKAKEERNKKFGHRIINKNLSLRERNQDIIDIYLSGVKKSSSDSYHISNLTRDCINDIMLAEGESEESPGSQYLGTWRRYADNSFGKLSDELVIEFKNKQKELKEIEEEENLKKEILSQSKESINELENICATFSNIENEYLSSFRSIEKKIRSISLINDIYYDYNGDIFYCLEDIFNPKQETKELSFTLDIVPKILGETNFVNDFLKPETIFHLQNSIVEKLNQRRKYLFKFTKDINTTYLSKKDSQNLEKLSNTINLNFNALEEKINQEHLSIQNTLSQLQEKKNIKLDKIKKGLIENDPYLIQEYIKVYVSFLKIDPFFQQIDLEYKQDEGMVIINYKFIDLVKFPNLKEVKLYKNGSKKDIQLSQKIFEDTYDQYLTAICIRTMYQIFEKFDQISFITFNGWIHTINKATGNEEDLFIMTVQSKKDECLSLNLTQIDPKTAFRSLKGISAAKLSSLTPINPLIKLNTDDHRFVEGYNVVDGVNSKTNLAAMDWQDFENLIRELFGKEFSINGGEVKITQTSRDGGVDAIAFDPDPIRGGKIVIQAKRYTNTVDVSAVRDLHGTVQHEGANKGILVTTATFGSDSYDFIKNKPLTLIDGGGLLYLLEKHGYSAKIDLREAKKILNLRQK